jgi:hypothetical protein
MARQPHPLVLNPDQWAHVSKAPNYYQGPTNDQSRPGRSDELFASGTRVRVILVCNEKDALRSRFRGPG